MHTCVKLIHSQKLEATTRVAHLLQLPAPKVIVYLTVCSWCCVFYGFRQKYNDTYPSL